MTINSRSCGRAWMAVLGLVWMVVAGGCAWRPSPQDIASARRFDEAVAAIADQPLAREVYLTVTGESLQRKRDIMLGLAKGTKREIDKSRREMVTWTRFMAIAQRLTPPPAIALSRVAGPIVCDGELDEPAWQHATPIALVFSDNGDRLDASAADLRVAWSDEGLHLAYRATDATPVLREWPRDGTVYRDDCVEWFIMPESAYPLYWEWDISPAGPLYDAWYVKHADRAGQWIRTDFDSPGMTLARRVDPMPDGGARYVVEMSLPWSMFPNGIEPRAGLTMRMIFARVDARALDRVDRVYHASSPTAFTLHSPVTWNTVTLSGQVRP